MSDGSRASPLISDKPDDEAVQDEIIRHCYVSTALSDDADKSLDRHRREPRSVVRLYLDLQRGCADLLNDLLDVLVRIVSEDTALLEAGVLAPAEDRLDLHELQQGHVTVPEVAKAVMQAIEELKGRSLAVGKIDDWLHRWEYAAADPDHDLGEIDFS